MKNRFLSALFILLLCAAMLSPAAAAENDASVLMLPEKLSAIEPEAFAGALNLEKVVLQSHTKRIGNRAFAGSGVREIYLNEELEYIADDAFAGCENLTLMVPYGSYAHRWAAFSDTQYVVLSAEKLPVDEYGLSGLMLSDDRMLASVYVTAAQDCVLRISILNEANESAAYSIDTDMPSGLQAEFVSIPVKEIPLEHFILEARLVDESGEDLCVSQRNYRYSGAFNQAEDAKPSDYPADRVLDYGASGFAVLAENVICIPGEAVVRGNSYTFALHGIARDGSGISAGDVLMLKVNGVDTPVKAASVTLNSDGTVTAEASEDIKLGDVYDKLSINGYMEPDGGAGIEAGNVFNYKKSFKYGEKDQLTLAVDAGMSINVIAQYDKKLLGEDYFLFDLEGKIWGNATGTLTGKYATKPDEIKLDLYRGKVIIPGVNLPADLTVTLPLNMSAEGTGTLIGNFEKIIGFSWDTVNGFVKKEDPGNNFVDAQMQVNFHADTGPKVILDVGIWDFFGAKVDAQVGLDGDGILSGKAHAGYEEPVDADEIHACNLCLDLDVDIFAKANANIYYNITDDISGDLLDENIFYITGDLDHRHWSIINESESCYGGVATWGEGTCPNYKYRAKFSTQERNGTPISGLPVTVTGDHGGVFELTSPGQVHLYDGNYTAEATFESGASDERFSIIGSPVDVVVKEKSVTVTVKVQDDKNGKLISGAFVVLTMPGGKTKTGQTGSDGLCLFEDLPGGTYSIKVSAYNYKTSEVTGLEYASGIHATHTANLQFDGTFPSLMTGYVSSGARIRMQDSQGNYPEGTPEVWVSLNKDTDGNYVARIDHEDCDTPILYTFEDITVYHLDVSANNMGENEYVYRLHAEAAPVTSTIFFCVRNGEAVTLEVFDDSNAEAHAGVMADAVFTAGNVCEGTLLPSGINFHVQANSSESARTGCRLYSVDTGYPYMKRNADGYYDIECWKGQYYTANNRQKTFGTLVTRYVMKDGKLVMDTQWFQFAGGTVTYP